MGWQEVLPQHNSWIGSEDGTLLRGYHYTCDSLLHGRLGGRYQFVGGECGGEGHQRVVCCWRGCRWYPWKQPVGRQLLAGLRRFRSRLRPTCSRVHVGPRQEGHFSGSSLGHSLSVIQGCHQDSNLPFRTPVGGRSLGALVARVSPPEPVGFCIWPQEL